MGIPQNLQNSVDFYLALTNKNVDLAKSLLYNGIDVDYRYKIGYVEKPAICIAAENNDFEMCSLLIAFGVSINQLDSNGMCPLLTACQIGDLNLVRLLLNSGANHLMIDFQNRSALHYAIQGQNIDIIQLLSSKGLPIDWKDCNNMTSLNILCTTIKSCHKFESKHLDILKFLIMKGASLINLDIFNYTPLHYILMFDFNTFYKVFLNITSLKNVNFNFKNRYGENTLHMLFINVSCGYSLNKLDDIAILNNFDPYIKIFLSDIIEINELNTICKLGFVLNIDDLYHSNVPPFYIDSQDNYGQTLLHQAVKNNLLFYAEYLVRKDANPFLKDKNSCTPFHYICYKIRSIIVDMEMTLTTMPRLSPETLRTLVQCIYLIYLIHLKFMNFNHLPFIQTPEIYSLIKEYIINNIPILKILTNNVQTRRLLPESTDNFLSYFKKYSSHFNKNVYIIPTLKQFCRRVILTNLGVKNCNVLHNPQHYSDFEVYRRFSNAANIPIIPFDLYLFYVNFVEFSLPTQLKEYILFL